MDPRIRHILSLILMLMLWCPGAESQTLCAKVRIEIMQELALERQGFEAHLKVTNSLENIALDQLKVTLNFTDDDGATVAVTTDPNDTGATFFYRQSALEGISQLDGTGSLPSQAEADARWLIIPARGAAKGVGTRYFVGAKLSYIAAGQYQEIDVAPDFITVSPMPDLQLDYFLPLEVYADDPLTQQIEPTEPFSLGVRVKNQGRGVARSLSIESAQPKILDNEQGLLINFLITGSFVDDQVAKPTLKINFGDIPPLSSRIGRWVMETNLSGRFTDFTATFTHADDLGGKVTSLLSAVNTHRLVRDVLVELPGRDRVRDILGSDGGLMRVFESDSIDTFVTEQSGSSTITFVGQGNGIKSFDIITPHTAGAMYVEVKDPEQGKGEVVQVVRDDGKILPNGNVWHFSRGFGPSRDYLIGLFDVNGGGRYRLDTSLRVNRPVPPAMQYIPDRTRIEGQRLGFIVEASDPNGTIPSLSIDQRPFGSTFIDRNTGLGIFDWPTLRGQAGRYPVTFRASDGVFNTARSATITLKPIADLDNDGIDDQWEMLYFSTLSRDGSGDFDGDGITDREEFDEGSDPTDPTNAPGVPIILDPEVNGVAATLTPELIVLNGGHGREVPSYEFEVYSDLQYSHLVVSSGGVAEGPSVTRWSSNVVLLDNTEYFWRVRAVNSLAASAWVYGEFVVDTTNDDPSGIQIDSPPDGTISNTLTPTFKVTNATDPDGDPLKYGFQVGLDTSGSNLVLNVRDLTQGSNGFTTFIPAIGSLVEDTKYFWRGFVTDGRGSYVSTPWASLNVDTGNNPPTMPLQLAPGDGQVMQSGVVTLRSSLSADPEGAQVTYQFELDRSATFTNSIRSGNLNGGAQDVSFSVNGLQENVRYYWRVSASDGAVVVMSPSASFVVNAIEEAPTTPTINNPGSNVWVQTAQPLLVVNPASDPEGGSLSYRFEVYGDAGLSQLVESAVTSDTFYRVTRNLSNHTRYYWRVQSEDLTGLKSAFSAALSFFVNSDGVDDAPQFNFTAADQSVGSGGVLNLSWNDYDPESDAQITLRVEQVVIATRISEDLDQAADQYSWPVSGLLPGVYTVYADVTDGNSTITVTGPKLTVIGVSDSDEDGVPDGKDNCPNISNANQKDRGGVGVKKRDGIGDLCQCGDVNGDGVLSSADVTLFKDVLAKKKGKRFKRPELCQVAGNAKCDKKDLSALDKLVKAGVSAAAKKKVLSAAAVKKVQICSSALGRP